MKKVISLLLTMLLLTAVLPASVLADESVSVSAVYDSINQELANGDTIATVEGMITLEFDGAVTDEILEGITITADEFVGVVAAGIDEADASKVQVRFGRLAEGSYTLSVPAAEFTFDFFAEVKYLTNTDFSDDTKYPLYDTETGVQPAIADEDNLGYLNGWGSTSKAYARVLEGAGDAGRYLSISAAYGAGKKNNAYGLTVCADESMGNNFNTLENVSADKVFVVDSAVGFSLNGEKSTTAAVGILAGDSSALSAKTSILGPSNDYMASNMAYNNQALPAGKTSYKYEKSDDWVKPRLVLRTGCVRYGK